MAAMRKVFFISLCIGAPVLSAAPAAMGTLSLAQAIELAIQNNLSTKLAQAATEEARGQALTLAAGLLPRITGSIQQTRVFKVNLQSQGFPANGPFDPLLGPYNSFDARFQIVQKLLDMNALWLNRLGKINRRISELQETLAREQVAAATALAYLEAQRSQRSVRAAEAELQLSEGLFKLARDQHQAGLSTGVDVARAETNAAQEKLRLIRAQVAAQQADLRLKRVVGLPLESALTLPEVPRDVFNDWPVPEKAVAQAGRQRPEIQIASENLAAALYALRSIEAENLPTLKAMADYGHSGTTPDRTARTGSVGGRLDLPIFSGGSTHGRLVEAQARKKEAEDRYRDIVLQVEEDVRLSLQTLAAEIEETRTADKAADLAHKELRMARDRFSAGVGDNIQLLSAQTALDRAMDDQVEAFARYDTARVNLATALGRIADFK